MDTNEIKKLIEQKKIQLAKAKESDKAADERHKEFIAGLSRQASNPSNIKSGASKSIRNQIKSSKDSYAKTKDARKRGYEVVKAEIERLRNKLK